MRTVNDIRKTFMDYFAERGHRRVDSWPLIPPDDPTLLFTSAGMVPFKPYYSGNVEVPFRRACSVQKCLRAGGKGSDLENVGRTIRHHTFFEMLGNFSFGDYFKAEAIEWAWDFVIRVMEIDAKRLYVTIYEDDDEAEQLWKEIAGVPGDRIYRMGTADNYWGPAGDTGACGPCSEIHIDMGAEFEGPDDPAEGIRLGAERYLEFWNLVFPQFDQQKDGTRLPLKNRGIDTGMGLERLACILQNVTSPYHTNEIKPICDAASEAIGVKYQQSRATMLSINVVADHIRALTFVINEGTLPSNEGRGYVMRRILRRAVRHGKKVGVEQPFLSQLVEVVVDQMGSAYPELKKNPRYIKDVIRTEEERFFQTLNQGLDLLDGIIKRAGKGGRISGEEVFRLYDTYGFPVDMTEEIAEEHDIELDMEGFESELQKQKKRSQEGKKFYETGELMEQLKSLFKEHGATEFVGYDKMESTSRVLAAFKDGHPVSSIAEGDEVGIVLDKTPFYAEAGGQIGDCGRIESEGCTIEIDDTQKSNESVYVHHGKVTKGSLDLEKASEVRAEVDSECRLATMRNHTATHLLQGALKRIVGEHVTQSGSYVSPEGLRFDFTHLDALTPEQLEKIQEMVNEQIFRDMEVTKQVMAIDEAKKMGAIAPFGEKYGEIVRVVKVGDFSTEFCGGTHLDHSGQIGPFVITNESSIAAGVRRIEAQTGKGAEATILKERRVLDQLCRQLSAPPEEASERLDGLNREIRDLRKQLQQLKQKQSAGEIDQVLDQAEVIDGVTVVVHAFDGLGMNELRNAADVVKSKSKQYVACLGSAMNGKVSLICAVSQDLHDKLQANELIKPVAKVVNGGGGGRPDLAQAGGKQPAKLDEALETAKRIIREKMK